MNVDILLLYFNMSFLNYPYHHRYCPCQRSKNPNHRIALPKHFKGYDGVFCKIERTGIQPGADIGKMTEIGTEQQQQ